MFAIAWISTAEGRRWAAVRGVMMLLAGIILHVLGWLAWRPMTWLGGGLLVLGLWCVAWAYSHASREGLPVLRSASCSLQKHGECAGSTATGDRCVCHCHFASVDASTA
jgi:hypothetical protein